MSDFLTVGELARLLEQPEWLIRRVVDRVIPDASRAGRYRMIPRNRVVDIAAAVKARLRKQEACGVDK